jgi:hypothetical protein
MDAAWAHLEKLPEVDGFDGFPEHRRRALDTFSGGFREFVEVSVMERMASAPERLDAHAKAGAALTIGRPLNHQLQQ